ncbi:N-acetylmuramoyl-L-alanine amidase [Thalassotalea ponticola]|uniref:N-acetylmuramoyl-L-alanine amidase n=1 Tax=Thalassotalea ponticola TaxID=1523392 RepID=UPI003528D9C8
MKTAFRTVLLLLLSLYSLTGLAQNMIEGVRIWPSPDNTRVVFDLSDQPDYSYFFLKQPDRLVIDFKNTDNIAELTQLPKDGDRIKRIRTSLSKGKRAVRIVLDLSNQYDEKVFALPPTGPYGNRLVVDLHDRQKTPLVTRKPRLKNRDIVIGIDAGHGGEDPGSISKSGTHEKKITLSIAKRLQRIINAEPGMKAEMIRTGDYYVNLNQRTRLARKKQVDFLVSIHADAFHSPRPRGASVWIANDRRAESELSKWLKNREKNSELLGGGGELIKRTNDDNLAVFIADLTKDKSLEISDRIARNVIAELQKVTRMHKTQPQNASLAVLKSSDIPSMLVETGFISNPYDFKNLMSRTHQEKLAKAMFNGIKKHFYDYPPQDSLIANMRPTKHKISRGESLSVVAQRYNVSVQQLKLANNLKTDVVRVGQTLTIPRVN